MAATLTGRWGKPVNTAAHEKGGIHDDDTASELGFRGGTVAGSIHMEQFLPLLLECFGDAWWQEGVLSMYFRQATVDRQPVRCHLTLNGDGQGRVWMETEEGDIVMEGTAQLTNCSVPSALAQRLATLRPAGDLRILEKVEVGQKVHSPTRVSNEAVKRQLTVITESHDYFESTENLGQRVLPNTQIVRIFDLAEQLLAEAAFQPFVGLYGGIEVAFENGPVLAETEYESTSEVIGLSDSPKTEILWRESRLFKDGEPVARMIKMDRLLKNSSPLWDEST
jgi:hypothetical protein